MTFVHKVTKNLMPQYLLENIRKVTELHTHNTRSKSNYYVKKANKEGTKRSLFYDGIDLYNKLPNEVKDGINLYSFKSNLITYIKNSTE